MLTADDQATLADLYIDVPWIVYCQELRLVIYCPDPGGPSHRCERPFDRESALRFAREIRTTMAVSLHHCRTHGLPFVEVTPYVVHHGIVWSEL